MKYSDAKFFIILFIFLFFKNNIVFADSIEDQVFTIRNIKVNVSSTSSVAAKEIALQEAQEQGFQILMEKILLKGEYEKVFNLENIKVTDLAQEIEIESEKTTSVRYIGSIAVKFKKNLVLRILKANNIRFSITKSKPFLILPIYKHGGVTYLWDKENVWKDLWMKDSNDGSLIPIKASEGQFRDFIYFNPNKAIKKNSNNLKKIAEIYDSNGVLIAVLKKKFNRDKSKILLELELLIFRVDGGKTNDFKEVVEIDIDDFSEDFLLEAKEKVQNFVNNQWKVENILSDTKSSIKLTVNYNNLNEWLNIRNLINDVSIINRYDLVKFSKSFAVISVSFSGTTDQLKIAFKQSDLEFDIKKKKLSFQ